MGDSLGQSPAWHSLALKLRYACFRLLIVTRLSPAWQPQRFRCAVLPKSACCRTKQTAFVSPNTIKQYRYHDRVSAPRYTINKSKCKNSNKHIRFYRFVNCVFSYSPCISCWLSPTKTVVF